MRMENCKMQIESCSPVGTQAPTFLKPEIGEDDVY
jgi:hypothetical protein